MTEMKIAGAVHRKKKSRLVAAISALVLVLAVVAAVIFHVNIPTTDVITSADGMRITAIAAVGDDLVYTTSGGMLYRENENGIQTQTLELSKEANTQYGASLSDIRRIDVDADGKYVWINSSNGWLMQLEDVEGELSLKDCIQLPGNVRLISEKNGVLYLFNEKQSYFELRTYDTDNISAGPVATGYWYSCLPMAQGVALTLERATNSTFLSMDIVEENGETILYVLYDGGLRRISTDFAMNGWQGNIPALVEAKYEALYAEALKTTLEEEIDTAQLRALAETQAYEELGVVSFNESTGAVTIGYDTFDTEKYNCWFPEDVSYRGGAYFESEGKYYLLTGDTEFYSFDLAAVRNMDTNEIIKCKKVPGITLAALPKANGNSLFYDKKLNVCYIIYEASQSLSRIDLNEKTLTFTAQMDFNIESLKQCKNGGRIYYLYRNANEAEAGHSILRTATIGGQEQEGLLRAMKSVMIAFAVAAVIILLFAALCWLKPGFSEKFSDTTRRMAKAWKIYLVMLIPIALLVAFCYYPAVASIRLSFFDYTQDVPSEMWNNFAHYKHIFTAEGALGEFANMFFYLLFELLKGLVPPLIFAFFLTIMRNKGYSALTRTLLFIPGIIPGVATTLIWKTGIYGEYGVLNSVIGMLNGETIKFLSSSSTAKWSLVLMGFPYVGSYLIFYGAMMNVPDSYYEAAELDGITVMKRFIYIDLPMIFAQIKYVIITTFITSVQNFGRTYMTTGGLWDTKTPIHTMYQYVLEGNYGLASAYAAILFVFLFVATVLNFRMQKKDKEAI